MKRLLIALSLIGLFWTSTRAQSQKPVSNESPFLLKTSWGQGGSYAKYAPENHVLGCWSTALAQIFYYHQLQPTGIVNYTCSKGYVIRDTLSNHPVRWNEFALRMGPNSTTAENDNVARFSYMTAEAIRKDFGTGSYLEMVNPVAQIETHFPCDAEFYVSFAEPVPIPRAQLDAIAKKENIRNVVKADELISLISREIDSKRPVYFHFGNFTTYGHSTVIDGYRKENDTFWVHINYGSGGERNGWFDLFKPIDVNDDIKLRAFITIKPNA